ncbi:MAG: Uma2 family endonuclease [Planctomycetes bacterium]|nr:Uma2 family endonuclease [Planctomycetota bacterium]
MASMKQTTIPIQAWRHISSDAMPAQGAWTEEQYLRLTDYTSRLIEFTDGYLEVLPMPTDRHQSILAYLFLAFNSFLQPRGGKVHFAALRVRIRERKFREPDLLLLLRADDPRREDRFWLGADLVLEVVSKKKPERDLVDKVVDYAEARIPEYWIVNPLTETITVYRLDGDAYVIAGVYTRGQTATSVLLTGFGVDVNGVFAVD